MRMVTSGARSRFCQEEPSAKTTRKQTWVFAPISSIVFLNCLFMISLECRCARRDLDSFLLQIEVAGNEGGRSLPATTGVLLVSGAGPARLDSSSNEKRSALPRRRARPRLRLRACSGAGGGAVPLDRERRFRRVLPPGRHRDRHFDEQQAG